ncbi:MAG TPA: hypothetical protein VNA67_01890 [Pseudonocardiaceae bacterium]|nr:hypothetical protein [Pseudonocardiaceae bacterium]
MGYPDDHAAIVGVGGEQPPLDEDVQFSGYRLRQLVAGDPPSGGTALLIDGDQTQQPGKDFLLPPTGGRGRFSQGCVGLAG